jgi:hypothetical protein
MHRRVLCIFAGNLQVMEMGAPLVVVEKGFDVSRGKSPGKNMWVGGEG